MAAHPTSLADAPARLQSPAVLEPNPDLELVERAKAGYTAAFEQLVRQYDRQIYRTALHITQNREDAEDITQDVFFKAFQKLDQRLAASLIAKPSPIRTTHQALADELGSLREIVSRLLKNFAEQGWVRLGREQIEVVDEASLRKFTAL